MSILKRSNLSYTLNIKGVGNMEIRKMVFDDASYNVLTDEELKEFVEEIELKKELDLKHEKLMNDEVETIDIDDFAMKHRLKYGL